MNPEANDFKTVQSKEMLFTNVNVNHASNKRHLHLDVSNMLSLKELAVHILIVFFFLQNRRSLKLNVDLHKDGKCYRNTSTNFDIHIKTNPIS